MSSEQTTFDQGQTFKKKIPIECCYFSTVLIESTFELN